ncbi:NAD(P)H-binding protein [Kibdelosporangium persicum]|uniref:Nucleoside-diphosphate-sugar epimerase n=1 Tax=Kibdelosporangium persicum TaxID=2698649 RepID=A0ABX2EVU3_9PSEU|nr:NAD(P)H-binding protein [Kibdelosporangium persicum]NRN63097.1 Nucleoside-diphosphate-sugar epimerase [Kibdelosporangium persicum]
MRIMVVGGTGLLGYHVVEQARARGHEVAVVARTHRPGVDHAIEGTDVTSELLKGYDGVVFAGGVYDRTASGSMETRLRNGYVDPAVAVMRAAREAGCSRAAMLGSYYAYFERVRPEWKLSARHPYVRARLEQASLAREAVGPDLPLAIVEIPYVVGVAPGRVPNWSTPYVKWVRSPVPLVVPTGGTAVTSARAVAETTVTALEDGSNANIPVAEENLTWKDMVSRMAAAAGKPRKVREIPAPVLRKLAQFSGALMRLTRRPPEMIDIGHMDDLYMHEMYLEPKTPRSLDAEIAETVSAGS